jgi:hypothetical protein
MIVNRLQPIGGEEDGPCDQAFPGASRSSHAISFPDHMIQKESRNDIGQAGRISIGHLYNSSVFIILLCL